jgi:hypothetical protein
MDFDNTEQARQLATLPPEPPPRAQRGMWGTAIDSLRGAAAKTTASMLEVGRVIGPAFTLGADPGNAELLEAVKRPPDFGQNDLSQPFRDFERTLRPDPATASTAERLVYGAVGPMAELVGGAMLGGPAGILAASADTGFSQAEDLRQQGVDLATRTGVGALTATATAAGAFLPMAGSTLKSTAGLYLAGGPGGFMAQQAATSAILKGADYDEIAKQFDPLDPVGLAVSALVPLPFAVVGLRSAKVSQEVADAAMAHNLTAAQDAADVRMASQAIDTPEPGYRAPPARPDMDPPKPPVEVDQAQVVKQRVQAIEEASPEAKMEMARVRQEIADGLDDELGTIDADLIRIAAECALTA